MSEFIQGMIRGMDDEYLVSLRDRNAQVAANYQRNADKMVNIVRLMDEEIRKRGLNGDVSQNSNAVQA